MIEKRAWLEAAVLSFSGLLVAFSLSWLLLSAVNFSYGFWHDHGGIGEAIDQFGPDNRFKQGFHLTTPEQRSALFREINSSINHGGEGLQNIFYQVPGHPPQQLLREPEIVHLQDVARLVDVGWWIGVTAIGVWLLMWGYFVVSQRKVPAFRFQLAGIGLILVSATVITLIIGPVKVFYAFHHWVFPADNQWFFYYQESLMSTMMYAPVLFGWIAIEWAILAVLLFVFLQWLGNRVVVWAQMKTQGRVLAAATEKKKVKKA